MLKPEDIEALIPVTPPFRFVDKIISVDANQASGEFLFREDLEFYKGHFPGFPVTPGVILTECLGQAGCIPIAFFLIQELEMKAYKPILTRCDVEFFNPVLPGDRTFVKAKKIYFRKMILKCKAEMHNEDNLLICSGELTCKLVHHEEKPEWKKE